MSGLERLWAAPRLGLGQLPTPLEPCHRLREAVGGPLVWLKRDDCTGLALGGNKTRKLEYLLGDAIGQGCTGVVTFGALQSNHARQTAAACVRAGLTCDLVLTRAVDRSDDHYLRSGNLLLDGLLGASVHVVDDADAAFRCFGDLIAESELDGRLLYGVAPGGSDPVGTLGYVNAAVELHSQTGHLGIEPGRVVVASSTTGTAAGLTLGLHLVGSDARVDAACVYEDRATTEAAFAPLLEATAQRLGVSPPAPQRWSFDDGQLGDGYGVPTAAAMTAIETFARTEGVLLDPVYTAKAAAHLLASIDAGELAADRDVVFVHTGGAPGVFAYAAEWDPLGP